MTDLVVDNDSVQWIKVPGTYGQFVAPGSTARVSYILAYASLGDEGTGYTQLTKYILPVRELFDVGDLNFDELLQRDIDDHRVATEIIPYLLRQSPLTRFFPPILAVVVPVKNRDIQDHYPKSTESKEDHSGITHETTKYGSCIHMKRYMKDDRYLTQAELSFNPDQSKILVIDGQHRAMAILAIRRVKTGEWGDRGRDFKHFYGDLAEELANQDILKKLGDIQLPVCICYFPDADGTDPGSPSPVRICRKLFLDVNRNAKRPTTARTRLLDDLNIISVFTREILKGIRNEAGEQRKRGNKFALDIQALEYDTPVDSPVPKRELALCSVEMIYSAIYMSLFADDAYYVKLERRPQSRGRPPRPQKGRFIKECLVDEEVTTPEFKSWGYTNFDNEFDPEDIPPAAQEKLSTLFMDTWGKAIIKILSDLHPYACHAQAVVDVKEQHRSETGHGALAWRALFDGQGILWTVRNYANHQRNRRKELGNGIPVSDIESADNAIVQWLQAEFYPGRARRYWGKKSDPTPEQLKCANQSYNIWITQAFFNGILTAFAYLKKKLDISDPDLFSEHVDKWIAAWNFSLTRNNNSKEAFWRHAQEGLMTRYYGRLQSFDWYWFRYFTFEFMWSSEQKFPGYEEAKKAADDCRWYYMLFLAKAILEHEKKLGRAMNENDAKKEAADVLKKALKHSLGIKARDLDEWYKDKKKTSSSDISEIEEDDETSDVDSSEAGES